MPKTNEWTERDGAKITPKTTEYRYRRDVGTRRMAGTDWPIFWVVRRDGPREWVANLICNGIADISRTFRTRKAAMAYVGGK